MADDFVPDPRIRSTLELVGAACLIIIAGAFTVTMIVLCIATIIAVVR